jgi:hypothetical protein
MPRRRARCRIREQSAGSTRTRSKAQGKVSADVHEELTTRLGRERAAPKVMRISSGSGCSETRPGRSRPPLPRSRATTRNWLVPSLSARSRCRSPLARGSRFDGTPRTPLRSSVPRRTLERGLRARETPRSAPERTPRDVPPAHPAARPRWRLVPGPRGYLEQHSWGEPRKRHQRAVAAFGGRSVDDNWDQRRRDEHLVRPTCIAQRLVPTLDLRGLRAYALLGEGCTLRPLEPECRARDESGGGRQNETTIQVDPVVTIPRLLCTAPARPSDLRHGLLLSCRSSSHSCVSGVSAMGTAIASGSWASSSACLASSTAHAQSLTGASASPDSA